MTLAVCLPMVMKLILCGSAISTDSIGVHCSRFGHVASLTKYVLTTFVISAVVRLDSMHSMHSVREQSKNYTPKI